MRTVIVAVGCLLLGGLISCSKRSLEWKEYLAWLHNPDNNISQTKVVDDLKITVRLLPPEYLAYREIRGNSELREKKDSLVNFYRHSLNFILAIGPDTSKGMDRSVIMRKVYNYEQFVDRVMTLNFAMSDFISLDVNGKKYKPVLSSLDNVYGLNSNATLTVVFVGEKKSSMYDHQIFDFEWNDMTYTTGIHHFVFTKNDIEAIPTLQF